MFRKTSFDRVDQAVRAVHRSDFLPPEQVRHAAEDTPLPIGYAQTISQPSLVAEMTRELALGEDSRVLEIGTGSGYQTALLAELACEVYTVERIPQLAEAACARLHRLGYRNVHCRTGDGALGWPEAAPFDGIIVTAAPPRVPPALVEQLAPNGRMVIPAGPSLEDQMLLLVTKDAAGQVSQRELFGVRFVPLVTRG